MVVSQEVELFACRQPHQENTVLRADTVYGDGEKSPSALAPLQHGWYESKGTDHHQGQRRRQRHKRPAQDHQIQVANSHAIMKSSSRPVRSERSKRSGLCVSDLLNPDKSEPQKSEISRAGGQTASSSQFACLPSLYLPALSPNLNSQAREICTISRAQRHAGGEVDGRTPTMPSTIPARYVGRSCVAAPAFNAHQPPIVLSRNQFSPGRGSGLSLGMPLPSVRGFSSHAQVSPRYAINGRQWTTSARKNSLQISIPQELGAHSSTKPLKMTSGFSRRPQNSKIESYFPNVTLLEGRREGEKVGLVKKGNGNPRVSSWMEAISTARNSGKQNDSLQMLPISLPHGPLFIPVDITTASKAADDKRKRNAEASTRFREKRRRRNWGPSILPETSSQN